MSSKSIENLWQEYKELFPVEERKFKWGHVKKEELNEVIKAKHDTIKQERQVALKKLTRPLLYKLYRELKTNDYKKASAIGKKDLITFIMDNEQFLNRMEPTDYMNHAQALAETNYGKRVDNLKKEIDFYNNKILEYQKKVETLNMRVNKINEKVKP